MSKPTVRYDVHRMVTDMAARGWQATDLARVAGVSDKAVSRFLRSEIQTAPMAMKFATALGYTVKRYLIASREEASA